MSRSLTASSEALAQAVAALPPFEINTLSWALLHTISPDVVLRSQAELFLKNYEADPKFSVLLIELLRRDEPSLSPEQNFQIKQSGSIFFKQCILRRWIVAGKETQTIPDDVKAFIRDQIPDLLVSSHASVNRLLQVALKYIIQCDFPDRWPELIPKAVSFITSSTTHDSPTLLPALLIIRLVAKSYDLRTPESGKREILEEMVRYIFPILQKLLETLVQTTSISGSILESYLSKIFHSCVQYRIPAYLKDNQNLMPWMTWLVQIILKPLPTEGQPQDHEELDKWPHWKSKIRAATALTYLFSRHGNPSNSKKEEDKAWALSFLGVYSEKLIQMFLSVLQPLSQGVYMPDKFASIGLNFINYAIKIGKTYTMLRESIPQILSHILFPLMCFRQVDIDCWNEDPEEYLRKEFDILDDYVSPRSAAVKLMVDIAEHRNRVNLNNFMQFLLQVLQRYEADKQNPKLAFEKDGALLAIGSLSDKLKMTKQYRPVLEAMVFNHIVPDITSPFAFLRARACWAFVQFHDIKWTNTAGFAAAVDQAISLVKDTEKIVKIQAAVHIRAMLENETVLEKIQPILPLLLEAYMSMMAETENDELVTSLEFLIDAFSDDIAPFATALCTRLSEAFMRLWQESENNENAVGDMDFDEFEALSTSGIAAVECLRSIRTVLGSVKKLQSLYPQLEKALLPLLQTTINAEAIEYLEDVLQILSYLTYFGPSPISAELWTLFPQIYKVFDECGSDYIDDMLAPLDNYISRGKEQFLAPGTPYLEMVFDMYKRLVGNADTSERDSGDACKVIEVVLLYLRRHERVDALLPQIVEIAINRIPATEEPSLHGSLFTVLADALYYDPVTTLKVFEEKGATGPIFKQWFEFLQDEPLGEHQMKISILGLSSIFEIPVQHLPQNIQAGVTHILSSVLRLSKELQNYREERDSAIKEMDEQEAKAKAEDAERLNEAGDESDNDDVIEDDEDVPDPDGELKRYEELQENSDDEDLDEDEQNDLASLFADDEDDDEVVTAIEDVDECIYLTQIITGAGQREPEVYQKLFSSLTQDDVAIYNTLTELAKVNAAKAQQQQQQQ